MWQEGQDVFDDVSESFVLCALHQAKTISERWKYWSGTVPADVSIRLHRLESILSVQEQKSILPDQQTSTNPLPEKSDINSSQPFLAEIRTYPTIERYYTEPQHNIIIQGPDIRRLIEQKRRVHFWCCH